MACPDKLNDPLIRKEKQTRKINGLGCHKKTELMDERVSSVASPSKLPFFPVHRSSRVRVVLGWLLFLEEDGSWLSTRRTYSSWSCRWWSSPRLTVVVECAYVCEAVTEGVD